jgi:hypothetical protein
MKFRRLFTAYFVALVSTVWTVAGYAANCTNGKALYEKRMSGVEVGCSQSSCHTGNPANNIRNIQRGAVNPDAIANALASVAEMQGLGTPGGVYGPNGLTASDLADIGDWIFFAPNCPAATPNVTASPNGVNFGSRNVGTTSPGTVVTLSNTGGAAANSMNYGTVPAGFSRTSNTCTTSIAAGGSCQMTFAFSPTAAQVYSGNVTVTGSGGTNVSIPLSGTGTAVSGPTLSSSPSSASFGNVTVGQTSSGITLNIANSGGTAATGVTFTNSNPTEFLVNSNSCGTTIPAAGSCLVSMTYRPTAAGADVATLTINFGGGSLVISLSGTGTTGGGSGVLTGPSTLTLPSTAVGQSSAPQSVTLVNTGTGTVTVTSVVSNNVAEFSVTGSTCTTVAVGASCAFNVVFSPTAIGSRSGSITVTSNATGSPKVIAVGGTGTTGGPPANTAIAIEFYRQDLDHYFVTWVATEIADLDIGKIFGWRRTGQSFRVYTVATSTTSAVCRIYIPPGKGDGHYYGRDANECNGTMAANPTFFLESSNFFYLVPPTLGTCPAGTVPVYRLFTNRLGDTNHRYTTDRPTRVAMESNAHIPPSKNAWIAEGDGPDIVVMCAPPV